jgi:hypothetical protein
VDLCVCYPYITPTLESDLPSSHLTDWVLFIFVGVIFVLTLFIPETLAPVLLRRKAAKLRKDTKDESYHTLEELERPPFKETIIIALVRPLVMLFREPIVLFMSFCMSFCHSTLLVVTYTFVSNFVRSFLRVQLTM